jgi:hypothetical protein
MSDDEYIISTTDSEKLELLNKELIKVKHEIKISKLIYNYHDCDSYEDIFKDNIPILENKMYGILYAIKTLTNEDSEDS